MMMEVELTRYFLQGVDIDSHVAEERGSNGGKDATRVGMSTSKLALVTLPTLSAGGEMRMLNPEYRPGQVERTVEVM